MQTLSHVLSRPLLAASALVSLAALPAAAQHDAGSIWHSAGTVPPGDASPEPAYRPPASALSRTLGPHPQPPYFQSRGAAAGQGGEKKPTTRDCATSYRAPRGPGRARGSAGCGDPKPCRLHDRHHSVLTALQVHQSVA